MQFPLSIIIPTHKRVHILRMCLEMLQQQSVLRRAKEPPFEVIVVSDGPDTKTDDLMTQVEWTFPFQYFALPKSHQGICRKRAIEKARGKYILMIGDDILLDTFAVKRHLDAHERLSDGNKESFSAVLGHTTWDPTITVSPLMRWMEQSGLQFGYPLIEQYAHDFIPHEIQHRFSYTSHISLSSRKAFQHGFREDVSLYGWEDIEWGKRLADAGMGLYYEPDAKAYHHHTYTDDEVWNRSRLLGTSAVAMEKLVPEMDIVPKGAKRVAYFFLSFFPTYKGRHCREFLKGMREGDRAREWG